MMKRRSTYLPSVFGSKDIFLFVFLLAIAIVLGLLIAKYGLPAGILLVLVIIGLLFIAISIAYPLVGIIGLYVYTYFMFYLENFITLPVPIGIIVDSLVVFVFAVVLFNSYLSHDKRDSFFSNDLIVVLIFITVIHDFIQIFNPKSPFGIEVMAPHFRESIYLLTISFVTFKICKSYDLVAKFSFIVLSLSLLVAFYGLFQEYVGLRDFEWEWLRADPRRFELYYIWGSVRKWSFLSDPSVYGMLMAFCAIFCIVLAIGHTVFKIRIVSLFCAVIFLLAMSYSGTRTAYGMIPLGLLLYILFTLNNVKTLLIAIFSFMLFIVLLVGPFYGPTMNRIRSTFNRDDPSMSFRDHKRMILQDYVMDNPFGTGLGTANNVAKRLTVTADTDNGYLRTAVDKGVLGLVLQLLLYATVMIIGINSYYSLDGVNKLICAAYLCGCFALTFANYYQDVADQKPLNLLIASMIGLIVRFSKPNY